MESLPGDVLVDVLALLPPRSLALCRGVCRAWRAAVDAGGLLRADLLPLSVRGFFLETVMVESPLFFRRPSSAGKPRIAGAALDDYLQDMGYDEGVVMIKGCCDGLLLLDCCDPPYPPSPEGMEGYHYEDCLAFEPAVSPHYRVVRLPFAPYELKDKLDGGLEWPTDPFVIQVFSSGGSQRWEHRLLVREGEAACTLGDMRPFYGYSPYSVNHNVVFWHEALYVKCVNGLLLRVSLSDDKHQVIKMPAREDREADLHIGKSKNGVYCALVLSGHQLRVWLLHESGGKRDWVLMHDESLGNLLGYVIHNSFHNANDGPWILDTGYCSGTNEKPEEELEWDSDNDNVLNTEEDVEDRGNFSCNLPIIGFHPYKQVIFFHVDLSLAISYHWNSSKIQLIANLDRFPFDLTPSAFFVYTPCWIGDLS